MFLKYVNEFSALLQVTESVMQKEECFLLGPQHSYTIPSYIDGILRRHLQVVSNICNLGTEYLNKEESIMRSLYLKIYMNSYFVLLS